jgi:hypothetical protein
MQTAKDNAVRLKDYFADLYAANNKCYTRGQQSGICLSVSELFRLARVLQFISERSAGRGFCGAFATKSASV